MFVIHAYLHTMVMFSTGGLFLFVKFTLTVDLEHMKKVKKDRHLKYAQEHALSRLA